MDKIKLEQFTLLKDYIYKNTGLFYADKKYSYFVGKLKMRMEILNIKDFDDYFKIIIKDKEKKELLSLIEKLTVNETYFFRNYPQLQGFAEKLLPVYLKLKKKNNDNKINFLSAACSTGEEPYTLAIILKEMLEDFDNWNIKITACDIDRNVLHKANLGRYETRSLKDTPNVYKKKYFIDNNNGEYYIKNDIKKMVEFRNINLIDSNKLKKNCGLDFIFCRNVLIYFNDISRKYVLNDFFDMLKPGGYLFLGHSESVGRITTAYKLKSINNFLTYQKPSNKDGVK